MALFCLDDALEIWWSKTVQIVYEAITSKEQALLKAQEHG
jgi:hypothetical protein